MKREGKVITFYSYKGGTGRTMSLANVACYFAQRGNRVLVIDWDLEAPSLHQYFEEFCDKKLLQETEGLIEFIKTFEKIYQEEYLKIGATADMLAEPSEPYGDEEDFIDVYLKKTFSRYLVGIKNIGNLHLLKAGKQFDREYSTTIETFDWRAFHQMEPYFFECFAQFLKQEFDYVFIDSRTGLTDTAGICTTLMPEHLVLVFTPNKQSLDGVLDAARNAIQYRIDYDDEIRPLLIYPLPSRIEEGEEDLREKWKREYKEKFKNLFIDIYKLTEKDLKDSFFDEYFNKIYIKHSSKYSYGEELSILEANANDPFYLSYYYREFSEILEKGVPIWTMSRFEDAKRVNTLVTKEFEINSTDKRVEVLISSAYDDRTHNPEIELTKFLNPLQRTSIINIRQKNYIRKVKSIAESIDIAVILVNNDYFVNTDSWYIMQRIIREAKNK
ncbi:MAG: AAA family ATPase [Bacteroidota bacterium]